MRKSHIYKILENRNGSYDAGVVISYSGDGRLPRSIVCDEHRPEDLLKRWRDLQLLEKSDVPLR